MTDPILEGLIKARDQIGRPGYFHKHGYYKKCSDDLGLDYPCCVYGAVGFAVDKHPAHNHGIDFSSSEVGMTIITMLKGLVPTHLRHSSSERGLSLIEYTDRKATTQADVVNLFNRAIERRKAA